MLWFLSVSTDDDDVVVFVVLEQRPSLPIGVPVSEECGWNVNYERTIELCVDLTLSLEAAVAKA